MCIILYIRKLHIILQPFLEKWKMAAIWLQKIFNSYSFQMNIFHLPLRRKKEIIIDFELFLYANLYTLQRRFITKRVHQLAQETKTYSPSPQTKKLLQP